MAQLQRTVDSGTAQPTLLERLLHPRRVVAIAFILPATLLLLAITIYPLIYTVRLAFLQWELSNFNAVPTFVGLQNFADALQDERFGNSLWNTARLIIFGIGLELVLGVGLALVLNGIVRFRSILVALFLIPVMIAPVVAGYMFRLILHQDAGPLNYLIYLVSGGASRGVAWISDPDFALYSIMITSVWQWTPFLMLIALAGLQTIPHEIEEAAHVDGASSWTLFWRVRLPLLLPMLAVGLIIRFMDVFKTFDLVYLLTGGGPGSSTETVAYYTYLKGFRDFTMGYTAALAFIQLFVIILFARLILMIQNRRRGEVRA